MKSTSALFLLAASAACSFTTATTSFAGSAEMDAKSGKTMIPPVETKPPVEINFRASTDYVFSGDFRFEPAGDQDALHSSVLAGISIPLTKEVYYTFNGFYDRYDFSTSDAPVPTTLQKLGADIAFEFRAEGEVAVAVIASPGFYGSEITEDAFNVPVTAFGSYRLTPSLVVVAGARYNQWSEYQILPSAGLIWTVNDRLKVRAIASTPRVEYTVNPDLQFSVGGELTGGTYRADEGEQNFSRRHLDYYDVRAGAGVTYKGLKPVDLNFMAGWSFERNFRYDDIDQEYRVEGAPYVAFTAKAVF